MLSFKFQGVQFNVRAAAVVLEDGYLLLHRAEGDQFWVLPGGRVEPGESACEATVRELLEETGQRIECQGLAFCVENFFEWQGQPAHEVGFYFHAQVVAPSFLSEKLTVHETKEGTIKLEYRWFKLAELPALSIYPEFLRTAALNKGSPVQHIVQGTPHKRRQSDA